jgi:hypothetical protein
MKNLSKQLSKSRDELPSHRIYLSNERTVDASMVIAGDVIRFVYDGEERTVFVVNSEWQSMLHGLTMNVINRRDLMVEVISKRQSANDVQDFYNVVLNTENIKKIDCYRTYKLDKIQNLRRLDYQIDERGREEL